MTKCMKCGISYSYFVNEEHAMRQSCGSNPEKMEYHYFVTCLDVVLITAKSLLWRTWTATCGSFRRAAADDAF